MSAEVSAFHLTEESSSETMSDADYLSSPTAIGVGLMHAAALLGDVEAMLSLARRYRSGHGVEKSADAAAW